MDDYSFGIALGQKRRAEGAEKGMASALAACDNLEVTIRQLREALAVETAHAGGLEALLDAYMAGHPNSPLRVSTGRHFKVSGKIKTVGRMIYEAAFDKIAMAKGIITPTKFRTDYLPDFVGPLSVPA